FNAANEVAVAAFLDEKIAFGGIARLVEATMEAGARVNSLPASADDALLRGDSSADDAEERRCLKSRGFSGTRLESATSAAAGYL
ncbi:MAG: hypothetical protein V4710_20345, partial [Verrucomicrobiota bacterium]